VIGVEKKSFVANPLLYNAVESNNTTESQKLDDIISYTDATYSNETITVKIQNQ